MKIINKYILGFGATFLLLFVIVLESYGQNVMIGITAKNEGMVKLGDEIMVEITIHNASSRYGSVLPFRLKPQFNVDVKNLKFGDNGHQLPTGWSIVGNEEGDLRLSNGTDSIPPNASRSIRLKIKAVKTSTGNKVLANLFFANGRPPGNLPGPSLEGDLSADNSSFIIINVK